MQLITLYRSVTITWSGQGTYPPGVAAMVDGVHVLHRGYVGQHDLQGG